MYKVIKSVIESKRYELAEMLTKIDTFWVQGSITEEDHNELVALARENALPENSYASLQKQIDTLYQNMAEMAKEILTLKNVGSGSDSGIEDPTEDYPEYIAPTGAHDAYYAGAKVTYNGVKYICIAPEGTAVVWNPDVMPSFWQEVIE